MPELLDLRFLGEQQLIGAYLLDLDEGLTLVDCGPATTLPTLEKRLGELDLGVADLRHLLVTHIHFDHAGAAGALVATNPRIKVHVSEQGAPHMIDPERLERSARLLYGDMFDLLWGPVTAVPAENIEVVGKRVLGLECFPTPGHALHHVCYMDTDGVLYAGDSLGVRFFPAGKVVPATPPPDVDLESWHQSLDAIEARVPNALALPHFGIVGEPEAHLQDFRRRLMLWAEIVRRGADVREFAAEASREIDAESLKLVELTEILRHSYLGLKRYWAVANG